MSSLAVVVSHGPGGDVAHHQVSSALSKSPVRMPTDHRRNDLDERVEREGGAYDRAGGRLVADQDPLAGPGDDGIGPRRCRRAFYDALRR
jgi:hypothetical protein